MNFGKHGTFYIRNNWISKAIRIIDKYPFVFSPKHMEKAIDELGIGRAMVESLRYWLEALDITYEERESNEIRQNYTEFGKMIKDKDIYLERKGTLWLLHYKLACSKEIATAWYWFFNEFKYKEFDSELFINELELYIRQEEGKKVSKNTLKKDFLCLKNTYLYESDYKYDGLYDIEEAISSPLRELKLIIELKNRKIYSKNKVNIRELAPEIFYYIVLENLSKKINQISIEDLTYKEKSPGKIFNLNMNDIYDMVCVLENKSYIRLNKKFGNNYIEICERDKEKILDVYYSNNKID